MTARTVAEIEPSFARGEPEERRIAVQELAGLRAQPGVVPLFLRALGDEDWRVRKEAASLTPRVEPKEELLRALARALEDRENIGLRNAAVEALVRLGPDAVATVLGALETLDADGRKLAIEALAGIPDPRGVTRLIAALGDSDANVVIAAAEALGRAGLASEAARIEAAAALERHLQPSNAALALSALESLVVLEARLPFARILPLVEHPLLRRAALAAAAHSRQEPALEVLAAAMGEATGVGREVTLAVAAWLREEGSASRVTERLGELLRGAPETLGRLRRQASEGTDVDLRSASLLLLGAARDGGDLPLLVATLEDEEHAQAALLGLELFGPAATTGLAGLLEVAAPSARTTLLELLVTAGASLEPRALRVVREHLTDTSSDVVVAAAAALAAFGDERDLGRLVSLTVHGESRVAEAATNAVSALATRHPAAARALLGALDPTAEHAAAGAAIVSALARAPQERGRPSFAADLVGFGERALRSADARARRLAVEALAASGDAGATAKVTVALSDEEREVRLAAVRALGELGASEPLRSLVRDSTDEETVSVALRALASANASLAASVARELVATAAPAIASTAVEVFARAAEPERTEGLLSALEHGDKDVVMLALSELGSRLSIDVIRRAAACLTHPAWEVRRLASEIFGEERSPAARELLRARLELELEPEVREALTEALSIRPPREGNG